MTYSVDSDFLFKNAELFLSSKVPLAVSTAESTQTQFVSRVSARVYRTANKQRKSGRPRKKTDES